MQQGEPVDTGIKPETLVGEKPVETKPESNSENRADFVYQNLQELISFAAELNLPPEKITKFVYKIRETAEKLHLNVLSLVKENEFLHYQLTHEPKTELLNMLGFTEEIKKYFASGEYQKTENKLRSTMNGCFVFIDLNGMKGLNDQFGYDETDRIIERFAMLSKELRVYDIPARRSNNGDEFVIFLPKANPALAGQIIARRIYKILLDAPITGVNIAGETEEVPITYVVGVEPCSPTHPDPINEPEKFASYLQEKINNAGELEKIAKKSLGTEHDRVAVSYRNSDGSVVTTDQAELLRGLVN
ncbi:MAG: GGDEF domain-containing protein [Candidatus Berkelbacteria bacterium]|nr:GGDEF domain-containing protein [Candidatus Berkelbacteria bacterium]